MGIAVWGAWAPWGPWAMGAPQAHGAHGVKYVVCFETNAVWGFGARGLKNIAITWPLESNPGLLQ